MGKPARAGVAVAQMSLVDWQPMVLTRVPPSAAHAAPTATAPRNLRRVISVLKPLSLPLCRVRLVVRGLP